MLPFSLLSVLEGVNAHVKNKVVMEDIAADVRAIYDATYEEEAARIRVEVWDGVSPVFQFSPELINGELEKGKFEAVVYPVLDGKFMGLISVNPYTGKSITKDDAAEVAERIRAERVRELIEHRLIDQILYTLSGVTTDG